VRQLGVNRADAAGNHDRLVVASAGRRRSAHIRGSSHSGWAAKLVVERRAAQRAFRHDLQRLAMWSGLPWLSNSLKP
jgi:hypothetical protein